MRHQLTGFVLALAATAAPAAAQDVWDEPGGIETAATYEAAVVAAPDAGESVLYTLRGSFEANLVLDSGAILGFRTSGGLDKDNPARAGFSGVIGPAPALASPVGAFSGLGRADTPGDTSPRARIETGYIYMEGGYGELRAGLDKGVATRFYEGAPSLFRHAALVNPKLDPTGQVLARTDHDLTGPSLKVSYATPRILGVRAGVSLTPEADTSGLDRDPTRGPDIENAAEVALNVSRRLPRSGVRLRAGAAYSEADAAEAALQGAYGRVETWSAGGSVEFASLAFGASYLTSNNGLALSGGDYSALSAGVRMTFGKIDAGLAFADATDDAARTESDTFSLSLARNFGERWRIAGGWQALDTRFTGNRLPLAPSIREKTDGIVIEITLSG